LNLGYQKAEDSVHPEVLRHNWIRTFRANEIPEFSDLERSMLDAFVEKGEITRLVIYLTEPKFGYELDDDLAEYVVRELICQNTTTEKP